MNLGATIVSLLLLDRVGRRPLLLLGIAGMGLSLTHLGYLFGVSNVPRNAILFDLIAYLASFAVGLGPIFWLLISEIYPTTVRGQAMSLSSVVIWLSDLLVTMTFLSLVEGLGARASFWLFAERASWPWSSRHEWYPRPKGARSRKSRLHGRRESCRRRRSRQARNVADIFYWSINRYGECASQRSHSESVRLRHF